MTNFNLLTMTSLLQDWSAHVPDESPAYDQSAGSESHADLPHAPTSPAEAPFLETLASSGPLAAPSGPQQPSSGAGPPLTLPLALGPGPYPGQPSQVPPAPGLSPLHGIPGSLGAGPMGSVPSAPAAQDMPGTSMQQLQAALSAQAQVRLLHTGLETFSCTHAHKRLASNCLNPAALPFVCDAVTYLHASQGQAPGSRYSHHQL